MKLEDLKGMSDDTINVLVCELMGWERFSDKDAGLGHEYYARFEGYHFKEDTVDYGFKRPRYVEDLNLCHKMEENLTDIQFCKYVQILCEHATRGERITWTGIDAGKACRATARQRCEAFVLTMSKETHE